MIRLHNLPPLNDLSKNSIKLNLRFFRRRCCPSSPCLHLNLDELMRFIIFII